MTLAQSRFLMALFAHFISPRCARPPSPPLSLSSSSTTGFTGATSTSLVRTVPQIRSRARASCNNNNELDFYSRENEFRERKAIRDSENGGGFVYFDRVRIGDVSAIDESFFPRSINLTRFPRLRSIFQIMCIKLNNFGILKKERNISKGYALQVHASFLPVMFNLEKLTESRVQTANSKPYWTRKVRPLPLSLSLSKLQTSKV